MDLVRGLFVFPNNFHRQQTRSVATDHENERTETTADRMLGIRVANGVGRMRRSYSIETERKTWSTINHIDHGAAVVMLPTLLLSFGRTVRPASDGLVNGWWRWYGTGTTTDRFQEASSPENRLASSRNESYSSSTHWWAKWGKSLDLFLSLIK